MVIRIDLSGTEQSGPGGGAQIGAQIIDDRHETSNGPGPNVMDAATITDSQRDSVLARRIPQSLAPLCRFDLRSNGQTGDH